MQTCILTGTLMTRREDLDGRDGAFERRAAAFVLEAVFEHGSPRHDCLADFVPGPRARFQP